MIKVPVINQEPPSDAATHIPILHFETLKTGHLQLGHLHQITGLQPGVLDALQPGFLVHRRLNQPYYLNSLAWWSSPPGTGGYLGAWYTALYTTDDQRGPHWFRPLYTGSDAGFLDPDPIGYPRFIRV